MVVAEEGWRFVSWLRDRAYDTVFHVGDTALQFTSDLIGGPDTTRHQNYASRQLAKQERKSSLAPQKAKTEKPLSFAERQTFTQIMQRRAGESLTGHWKRRKELLRHPQKRQLINIEQKVEGQAEKERSITVERRSVAQEYQQARVSKQTRSRKRSR